jgi:diketogulonate reductase-like aldo/keto reductase
MQQVADGLRIGYRMIDTASHYENEADVANALQRAKVSRSDVFLITKIWFDDMGDRAAAAIQESLARLSTDYVDLLLMHFPGANDAVQSPGANRKRREETWRAMEEAKARGQAKDIGVANFTRRHLKELFEYCRTPPAVLQTEIHPYFQQSKLVEFCRQSNLQIQSFSPLAHGELNLLEDKLLKSIAAKHGKTPAQVVLRWLQQLSITPIVFSRSRQRLEENWATVAADFTLSAGEMDRISFLDRDTEARIGFNPNLIA